MKFVLCLYVTPGETTFGDWYLLKTFESQTLPRVDEFVEIGGNAIRVDSVYHNLLKGVAESRCLCNLYDACHAFVEDPSGWTLGGANRKEKEEFRKTVKRLIAKRSLRSPHKT